MTSFSKVIEINLIISFLFICVNVANCFALEGGEAAAKIFLETYAKEQVKHRLSEYLNENPEALGSTDPRIGSKSVEFLGKLLTVYNLMTAKTEKEKAVSAFYFIYTPDPTTAVIIMCAQIIDTMISLSHNRELLKTYEESMQLNRETTNIYSMVNSVEVNRQAHMLGKIEELLINFSKIKDNFLKSKIFSYVTSGFDGELPTDEELSFELQEFSLLIKYTNELRVQKIFFDKVLGSEIKYRASEAFGFNLDKAIDEYLRVGDKLIELDSLIIQVSIRIKNDRRLSNFLEKAAVDRKNIRSYYFCVNEMNNYFRGRRSSETQSLEVDIYEQCKQFKYSEL